MARAWAASASAPCKRSGFESVGPRVTQVRQGAGPAVPHNSAVVENLVKLAAGRASIARRQIRLAANIGWIEARDAGYKRNEAEFDRGRRQLANRRWLLPGFFGRPPIARRWPAARETASGYAAGNAGSDPDQRFYLRRIPEHRVLPCRPADVPASHCQAASAKLQRFRSSLRPATLPAWQPPCCRERPHAGLHSPARSLRFPCCHRGSRNPWLVWSVPALCQMASIGLGIGFE